ncbi:MAG: serine acetyltransferase [Pseudomonadota bacterium]
MFSIIRADFRRKQKIFQGDGAPSGLLRMLVSDGASAIILFRATHACGRHAVTKPLALVLRWFNKFLNGCFIGVGADFGPGFVIMHPEGVIINSKVRAGRNITLESGVVIGDDKGRSPVLGSDIYVGAGAKIIGELEVGDNVKIGANAVVTKSAPDGSTMLGIPARPYGDTSA